MAVRPRIRGLLPLGPKPPDVATLESPEPNLIPQIQAEI